MARPKSKLWFMKKSLGGRKKKSSKQSKFSYVYHESSIGSTLERTSTQTAPCICWHWFFRKSFCRHILLKLTCYFNHLLELTNAKTGGPIHHPSSHFVLAWGWGWGWGRVLRKGSGRVGHLAGEGC